MMVLLVSGCVNKHGISAKYYSECDEYYDMQGFYHKKCGKDDMFTYKAAGESVVKATNYILGEDKKQNKNVWR